MKAEDLRKLDKAELNTKINQWEEELFRARISKWTSELKDTSMFKKLRKDIARGKLVLGELQRAAKPEDKAVTKGAENNG